MKLYLWNTDESFSPSNHNREHVRRRQTLTIIFAIVLIAISGVASAQSPQIECPQYSDSSLQYDGATTSLVHPGAVIDPNRVNGGALLGNRSRGDGRPAYVELAASLSNFDSDADPDGWRAEVVLRDRKDRPIVPRANATFELMPRVAMSDHHRYVDADATPIRWSMPLEFDDDSVARVKLPLRKSLRPMLGWSSAIYAPSAGRSRNQGRIVRGLSRNRTFITSDPRNLVGMPSTGEMRIRVSIPTEGVFEAAVPVRMRPSVLVDTKWPYR